MFSFSLDVSVGLCSLMPIDRKTPERWDLDSIAFHFYKKLGLDGGRSRRFAVLLRKERCIAQRELVSVLFCVLADTKTPCLVSRLFRSVYLWRACAKQRVGFFRIARAYARANYLNLRLVSLEKNI